jgi:hypothetical protein
MDFTDKVVLITRSNNSVLDGSYVLGIRYSPSYGHIGTVLSISNQYTGGDNFSFLGSISIFYEEYAKICDRATSARALDSYIKIMALQEAKLASLYNRMVKYNSDEEEFFANAVGMGDDELKLYIKQAVKIQPSLIDFLER